MRSIFLFSFFLGLYLIGFGQAQSTLPPSEVAIYNSYRINSAEHEFSPRYFQEGIVFVAAQTNLPATNKVGGHPFFKLYYAPIEADGMPSGQHPFSSPSSTLGNEGQASFTAKEDLIYYTSNNEVKNEKGQFTMKIYEARKEGNDWLHIVELPINSDTYSNRHPSISPDGQTLYFASDMPGGFGGSDLYAVKKEGAYWGIPQNLGPQINTAENDAFPFIYNDDYLFFSSKGHHKKEDYDIYAVNIQGGLPGPIIPLNHQFNSNKDDFGFILHPSGTKGFFSSNRKGGFGKDDIYLFESEDGFFPTPKKSIQEAPALATVQEHRSDISTPLNQSAIPPKEQPTKQIVDTVKTLAAKTKKSIATSPEKTTAQIGIKSSDQKTEAIISTENSKKTIEKIQDFIPTSKQPSTDKIAEEGIAATPETAIEVFTEKSVQCATLRGEITSATGSPLVAATVQVRSSCGGLPYTLMTNSFGAFESCLPINCQYIIAGSKEGYQDRDLVVSVNSTTDFSKTISLAAINPPSSVVAAEVSVPLHAGAIIEIPSLLYDLEHGRILNADNPTLVRLISLLQQYPSMTIEIVEHTDARGASYYNYELSQARATITKNHIIQSSGIAPKRIQAIGMGEQQLKNNCNGVLPCTDKEHQENKRTEIRIITLGMQ